jgi:pilus assembly protein Flp/PilA
VTIVNGRPDFRPNRLTARQSGVITTSVDATWERFQMKLVTRFLKDQSGATAIEYGLIAAGISIAIILAVNGLGTNLNDKFTSINTSLK